MQDHTKYHFDDITLLITHYNRSESLERLLLHFIKLNCSFNTIIVSDDASNTYHASQLQKLQSQLNFNLATTPQNKGLGNNINKGQDLIRTPYTLYIQEDFVPKSEFPEKLNAAHKIMSNNVEWDFASFYAYFPYPYLRPQQDGFSEKYYPKSFFKGNNIKFYFYSDHPHLRRSTFLKKFGRYNELVNSDQTELQMSLSVIKNKGKALFFDRHYDLLEQVNSSEEPSTASFRRSWFKRDNWVMSLVKSQYMLYKFIKLSLMLAFKKKDI